MNRRHLIAATALCAAFTASAQDLQDKARNSALADIATTGLGLALHAVELNPIGPIFSIGMKVGMLQYMKGLPEEEKPAVQALAASMWGGAAANNACVIASIVTGGGFAPFCVLVGIGYGMYAWKQTEPERIFWTEGCPMLRAYAQMPEMECVYTPVAQSQAEPQKQAAVYQAERQEAP